MIAAPPLYILRHGETEWNATGRLQGHYDSPLTSEGRAQAARQRAMLATVDLSGFCAISSPQGRALETAAIALEGLVDEIKTDASLREIGLGDWAGETRTRLLTQTTARDGFDLYQLAPNGEGFDALHSRCESFLGTLRTPAVLITHGITSRMMRLILTGQPINALRDQPGGQGVVFHVEGGIQNKLTFGS